MAKNIRAKFFEEQRETATVVLVEISVIGDTSTVVQKATNELKKHLDTLLCMPKSSTF